MLRAVNNWLTIRQVYMKRMSTAITYYSYRNSKNILNCCHTCHWIDKTAIGDRLRTFSWSSNIYVVLNTWWFSQSTMCFLFSPCSIVYKHEPKRTLQLQTLFKAIIIKYSIWKYWCLTNKNIFLSKIISKKFIIISTNHFQTWSYIFVLPITFKRNHIYLFHQSLSNVIILTANEYPKSNANNARVSACKYFNVKVTFDVTVSNYFSSIVM